MGHNQTKLMLTKEGEDQPIETNWGDQLIDMRPTTEKNNMIKTNRRGLRSDGLGIFGHTIIKATADHLREISQLKLSAKEIC